jgi:hypothetical protein
MERAGLDPTGVCDDSVSSPSDKGRRHSRSEILAEVAEHLRNGSSRVDAYISEGMSATTFYRWRREDPSFAALIAQSEAEAVTESLASIKRSGNEHWNAAAWLVAKKRRVDFGEKLSVESKFSSTGNLEELLMKRLADLDAGNIGQQT